MAIRSLHVPSVGHVTGSSTIAFCSYITSCWMCDERTDETSNGSGRRERVGHVCMMLPEDALGKYLGPERLFDTAEMTGKRSDARPVKRIMVALPREFNVRERPCALEDSVPWNITANGYVCTYVIRTDKDGHNLYARILATNRCVNLKTGRWAARSHDELALGANGRRIPATGPGTGW